MRDKRIIVISNLWWPDGGGAEFATHIIVKDILSKNFDVKIISGTDKPNYEIFSVAEYFKCNLLRIHFKPEGWIKLFMLSKCLKKMIREDDIVYIVSHNILPLAIILKKFYKSIKIVLHIHNYQPLTYNSLLHFDMKPSLKSDIILDILEHDNIPRAVASGFFHQVNFINSFSLIMADKLIFVSNRQFKIISNYIPSINQKSIIIYNPLPSFKQKPKNPSEERLFLYLGGTSYAKGFHILLQSLKGIVNKKFKLIFAGYMNPKYLKKLKKLAINKITLVGKMSHDDVLNTLNRSWSLIFPSIIEEPLPYAIVESLMTGTLPIASRIGGIPEIVENTKAEKYLFDPGNPDDLTNKLSQLFTLTKEDLIEISYSLTDHIYRKLDKDTISKQLLKTFMI